MLCNKFSQIIIAITSMKFLFLSFYMLNSGASEFSGIQLRWHSTLQPSEGLKWPRIPTAQVIHLHGWKINDSCCWEVSVPPHVILSVGCLPSQHVDCLPQSGDPKTQVRRNNPFYDLSAGSHALSLLPHSVH